MTRTLLIGIVLATLTVAAYAQTPKPLADVNHVTDLTLDSLEKVRTARPQPGSTRREGRPVLFLIGNSTMRNGTLGNGNNGQWGWGYYAPGLFDPTKISVENQALGGTSSRTFYNKLWPAIRQALKPGDWVIISIGHNDNGPYDEGRARASIPGTGSDSLLVTIKETGAHETVYSYGEYMRRFIADTRKAGAHPVLMSLTPRNDIDPTTGHITRKIHSSWLAEVARETNTPFVDLNKIAARKLDGFSPWKQGYHFYGDRIHTSRFGARLNALSAAEGIAQSTHPQLRGLQEMLLPLTPKAFEPHREKGKPVVWITGDSTVKNADNDPNGMWGWGTVAYSVFNADKVTCYNAAMAGRSTRTFLNEGRWERVVNTLQPGDYVLIQFGHNDVGDIDKGRERGVIPTATDSAKVFRSTSTGRYELVYSFGWYLKKFIDDVREKGATPILLSLTPRNEWKNGKIERRNDTLGKWYREVAQATGCLFIDTHNIAADELDKLCGSKEKAAPYYNHDHTHFSLEGARFNARCVAKGLKKAKSTLARFLLKKL